MNILVAPNALKGSLDPFAAADAIAEGLGAALPEAHLERLAIADGGDGTALVLVRATGGGMVRARVTDPLGRFTDASFGVLGGGGEAIIEVARSSGMALLSVLERDPMLTTSYGAGELVRAALDRGCRRIVVALGGSATVDGGAGFAEALGVRFLDARGRPITRGGRGLAALDRIDAAGVDPRLAQTELVAICDVDHVLLGERGAARTFGPQKGATPAMVEALEANLSHLAALIRRDCGRDVASVVHGGASGGLAAGIAGILGGRLESGSAFIFRRIQLDRHLDRADLVVTAEGHLDRQTLGMKAPLALARAARASGVPVVALLGGVADDVSTADFDAFDAIVPIAPRPMPLEEAMEGARLYLARAAERVGKLVRLGERLALSRQLS